MGQADGLSLLAIRLHTGRAHQIRVLFSASGCPLYGDQKYGQFVVSKLRYGRMDWPLSIQRKKKQSQSNPNHPSKILGICGEKNAVQQPIIVCYTGTF